MVYVGGEDREGINDNMQGWIPESFINVAGTTGIIQINVA